MARICLSGSFIFLVVFLIQIQTNDALNRFRRQGFVFQTGSSGDEACTTKDGQQGVCIEVVKCDEATRILGGNPTPAQRTLLRERTCRFEGSTPFFCCLSGAGQPDITPPPTAAPVPVTSAPAPVTPAPAPQTPAPLPPEPKSENPGSNLAELEKVCGVQTATGIRIVGGVPALLNAWPWMAAIFIDDPNIRTTSFVSGGVLISDLYILTASHCVRDKAGKTLPAGNFLIRLGDLDISSDTDGASPVDFNAVKIIPHEKYNSNTHQNDIALIKLDKPAVFSDSIRPICLPKESMRGENLDGMRPFIAGWGTVEFRGESSSVLRQVQVDVQSNQNCQTAYNQFKITISNAQLCAGFPMGGKDACQGDSGGPLMRPVGVGVQSNTWYTIGVVSVGFRCAEAGFPGIYTRTSEYLDWIKKNAELS